MKRGTVVPCYHPISAFRSPKGVFFHRIADCSEIQLPCGRCVGCRLERSRQWAVRLVHENRFHDSSSFITLTYDDKHLPKSGSLEIKDFQNFMKRFRKSIYPKKVRYFHAGEYGEKFSRPHYHAIIFGEDFLDGGYDFSSDHDVTWRCHRLDKLWPFGFHIVGDVTFESCAYVARYILKKVNGDLAESHYQRICESTGEVFKVAPEYCSMSRRPGIGALHFEKYSKEIYLRDEVMSRGFPAKPPRFYDRLLAKFDEGVYTDVKELRECALTKTPKEERAPDRLIVRETVALARIGALKRKYEL